MSPQRADEDVYAKASERHFELFKHLSTLDTAASLVVLAVYRELPGGILGSLGALIAFAASLLACLYGLLGLTLGGDMRSVKDAQLYMGVTLFGVAAFFLGVLVAALGFLRDG